MKRHIKKKSVSNDTLFLFIYRKIYYFATFSRRFKMMKMNRAANTQIPAKTPHTMVNGAPHIKAGILTRKLPIAVETNQPPIIIPAYFGGATLVTNEIPIGESNNSANVNTR